MSGPRCIGLLTACSSFLQSPFNTGQLPILPFWPAPHFARLFRWYYRRAQAFWMCMSVVEGGIYFDELTLLPANSLLLLMAGLALALVGAVFMG